jgi:hypothetical protein
MTTDYKYVSEGRPSAAYSFLFGCPLSVRDLGRGYRRAPYIRTTPAGFAFCPPWFKWTRLAPTAPLAVALVGIRAQRAGHLGLHNLLHHPLDQAAKVNLSAQPLLPIRQNPRSVRAASHFVCPPQGMAFSQTTS